MLIKSIIGYLDILSLFILNSIWIIQLIVSISQGIEGNLIATALPNMWTYSISVHEDTLFYFLIQC